MVCPNSGQHAFVVQSGAGDNALGADSFVLSLASLAVNKLIPTSQHWYSRGQSTRQTNDSEPVALVRWQPPWLR